MSVKQGWLPTLTKIQNKPYILVKNCTFMPKTQPAGALFHLLWSLVANSPEIGKISFCILILGIFSHHKENICEQWQMQKIDFITLFIEFNA